MSDFIVGGVSNVFSFSASLQNDGLGGIPSPERRQNNPHLSRDQRRDIQLLRSLEWSYKDIHKRFPTFSIRQIEYACLQTPTPKKRQGRPPIMSQAQVEELVEFVCASQYNRRMSYQKLAEVIGFGVKKGAIRTALEKEGFHRRLARRKPPISETNRKIRLAWAQAHINWTTEMWFQILWSDETWITGGRHTRTWVTRRPGEELDPTCIVEKVSKKKGWMFWGCFHGRTQGPGIFWEKDWGTINKESYCDHTVPVIHGYLEMMRRQQVYLQFMQDGAPGHNAEYTYTELAERGIYPIFWPAYSPDLNPIEYVWNIMKNYLQDEYPENMTYNALRLAVNDAWNRIGSDTFNELIESMHDRCQAVIDAEGRHTKY
jgi:transposase